jgi:hypothetical protein
MTDLTDEAVKALLDGATPGPWRADGEPWNRIVWSSADNRVCFMAHSSGLNDARDIATSNLIAAAPDLARALLDARAELTRLRADAAAMDDAVAHYPHPGYGKPYPITTILRDLASQEGCDGEPYDAMMFAAETIDDMRAGHRRAGNRAPDPGRGVTT